MGEDDSKAISHLEIIRHDVRDEIKKRIVQRDKYSIQLTISLGLIVSVSFASTLFGKVLLAAPLVSIYFTVLILYSYKVHSILAKYLRDEIEPELSRLCQTTSIKEWECYYKNHAEEVPGIRRQFFLYALWVVTLVSITYLWFMERDNFAIVLTISSAIYIFAAAAISKYFANKK